MSDNGAKLDVETDFQESETYTVLQGMQFAFSLITIVYPISNDCLKTLFEADFAFDLNLELQASESSFMNGKLNKASTLAYKMQGGDGFTGSKRVQSGFELLKALNSKKLNVELGFLKI